MSVYCDWWQHVCRYILNFHLISWALNTHKRFPSTAGYLSFHFYTLYVPFCSPTDIIQLKMKPIEYIFNYFNFFFVVFPMNGASVENARQYGYRLLFNTFKYTNNGCVPIKSFTKWTSFRLYGTQHRSLTLINNKNV